MQNRGKLSKKDLHLLEQAKKHAKKCYKKGVTSMAALLRTKNGNIVTGINVKYKKVWKCICAERVAIAKAIEIGETELNTIVTVKYSPEENDFSVVNMCGECRQVAVFYPDLKVISVDKDILSSVPIRKVFPYPYS